MTTAAARRMWQQLKQTYGRGGFLLFDKNGRGGAWYADNAEPDMDSTDIPVACPHSAYDLGTLEEFTRYTRNWLERREEIREEERQYVQGDD